MDRVSSVSSEFAAQRVAVQATSRRTEASGETETSVRDRVEISDAARELSQAQAHDGIRAEKVAAIREAIARGEYLTDDKINVTAARLLDELNR